VYLCFTGNTNVTGTRARRFVDGDVHRSGHTGRQQSGHVFRQVWRRASAHARLSRIGVTHCGERLQRVRADMHATHNTQLHSIAVHAARYKRAIQPLLSLSIDFYVRLFLRVHASPVRSPHWCGEGIG
jgi:hypothetical protein